MEISYFDVNTFKPMRWAPDAPPRFLNYHYKYNLDVRPDDLGLQSQFFKVFIRDVAEVKRGEYDDPRNCVFTHFTKLPHLYVELEEETTYKFPMIFDPHNNPLNGNSRMLVLTQYWPDRKYDEIRYNLNRIVHSNIDNLIEDIKRNTYWSKSPRTYTDVRVMVMTEHLDPSFIQDSNPRSDFYWISRIDFTNPTPFVFGRDWFKEEGFLEAYDYRPYVERINLTMDLWEKMKETIKKWPISTLEDYKDLLDALVLGNLDFARNWRREFFNK